MKFRNAGADAYVPDGKPLESALERVTHLGIGAHQDDLEFMAFHGIAACQGSATEWFGGVTCTDGSGSSRSGAFAGFSDERMRQARREEQRRAAELGRYGVVIQLDYPSAAVKSAASPPLQGDLASILSAARPKTVYTHNLADKHDTHVAVAMHAVRAIRSLPAKDRPQALYGCEVWRDLDWMPDAEKVVQDVGGSEALSDRLTAVFESQIAGGKRYDLAVQGRRRANATFYESHGVDLSGSVSFAMDLTPLVLDDALDPAEYVAGFIDRFRTDALARLARYKA